jgi:hypothetical protein
MITMDDDENLGAALDYLAYAASTDPRLKAEAANIAAMYLRVQYLTRAITTPAYYGDMLTLAGEEAKHRRVKAEDTAEMRALAVFNPELLSGRQLCKTYFPYRSDTWATSMRGQARAKTGRAVRAPTMSEDEHLPGNRKPVPEPMTFSGLYYSELPEDATVEIIPEFTLHLFSPFYLFHAWAWGRRMYAAFLRGKGLTFCPYSNLTVDELLQNNPRDGSGNAFLQLADRYRRQRAHAPFIVLPVPGYNLPAHKVEGWPLYNKLPHARGSSVRAFSDMLNEEMNIRGTSARELRLGSEL